MDQSRKYLYFMVALAVSLFFTALGKGWANAFAALLFLVAMMVAVWFISQNKWQRIVMLSLAALAVLPLWELALLRNPMVIETVNTGLWIILTSFVGSMIFRDIFRAQRIGSDQIYGVISVYLLIGVFFALIYQILVVFEPNAFYFNPMNFKGPVGNEGDLFYYSFITLSTVGYGDVSPVAPIARSVSVIEAIVGIMYVATMIARFVASHSGRENDQSR
ncbi:MAG: ion channel [Pyrinomonadaceae bacterium]